jgi:hypothetical protein
VTVTAPVVVKIFREESARRRLQRRLKGSKAERCFAASVAMLQASVPVPEPVAALAVTESPNASYFLYRPIGEALEARYFFRARNAGAEREQFPDVSLDLFLARLGALLRRMHDASLWHRDVSAGNVLLQGDWIPELAHLSHRKMVGLGVEHSEHSKLWIAEPVIHHRGGEARQTLGAFDHTYLAAKERLRRGNHTATCVSLGLLIVSVPVCHRRLWTPNAKAQLQATC